MPRFLRTVFIFSIFFFGANLLFHVVMEKDIPWVRNKVEIKAAKWNELKDPKNQFNAVFLGSSRGFLAYSPSSFDERTGLSSFNMCSGSQNIIESYFVLKDLLRYQHPKVVFYELFLPSFSENTDFLNTVTTAWTFPTRHNQFEMMAVGFGVEGIINYTLPLVRDRAFIKSEILRAIFSRKKRSTAGRNVIVKGHNQVKRVVSKAEIQEFTPIYTFDNTPVSDKMTTYWFEKFVKLCQDSKVELICLRAPYPPSRMEISSEDEAHDFFKAECEKYSLRFIDFNHLDPTDTVYQDQDFYDYHHMNLSGARKVSSHLAGLVSGPGGQAATAEGSGFGH